MLGERLSIEEAERIFARLDYDRDGFVTGEDFYRLLTQQSEVFD